MTPISLMKSVGKNCPNRPEDVKSIHARLIAIDKIPKYENNGVLDAEIARGIAAVQRHFMRSPDGVISVAGRTHSFLNAWNNKPVGPGVQLPGRLKEAWDWVSPLLPGGSYCSSGFRSADEQRRILHKFYLETYRVQLAARFGQKKYDEIKPNLLKNEQEVLVMIRAIGQAIAAPGRSMHQQAKAVDIGGPNTLDAKQVEVVTLVARAHPELFSGKVLKERNGCVHFEII